MLDIRFCSLSFFSFAAVAVFAVVVIIDYLFNEFSKVILYDLHSLSCVASKVLLDKLNGWLMIEQRFPEMPVTNKSPCVCYCVLCVCCGHSLQLCLSLPCLLAQILKVVQR